MKKLCLCFLLMCCGCSRPSSEVIVLGLGIELKEDQYIVHAEVGQSEIVEEKQYLEYVQGKGKSLEKAFEAAKAQVGRQFYYSHVQVIAVNHEMMNHLSELKQYLSSFKEIPMDTYIVVSNSPGNLFNNKKVYQSVKLTTLCDYRSNEMGIPMSTLAKLNNEVFPILLSILDKKEETIVFEKELIVLSKEKDFKIDENKAFLLGALFNWIDKGNYGNKEMISFNHIHTYVDNKKLIVYAQSNQTISNELISEIENSLEEIVEQFYFIWDEEITEVQLHVERKEV